MKKQQILPTLDLHFLSFEFSLSMSLGLKERREKNVRLMRLTGVTARVRNPIERERGSSFPSIDSPSLFSSLLLLCTDFAPFSLSLCLVDFLYLVREKAHAKTRLFILSGVSGREDDAAAEKVLSILLSLFFSLSLVSLWTDSLHHSSQFIQTAIIIII